jgi:integrase
MLTDRQIKNLPATGQPYRRRDNSGDPSLRGFGVQVSAAGTKTFYVEYSFGGRRGHFYRLGSYPGMSLAAARNKCREIRKLVDDGIDPKTELVRRRLAEIEERKAQERRAQAEQATALYEDLVSIYLESVRNQTTRAEIARLLEKDARPVLKGKRVTEITRADIHAVLARARKRGAKRVERMLHCYLHAAFGYVMEEREVDGMLFPLPMNPVTAVRKPDEGMTPRDRVLSRDEIGALWYALELDAERISLFTGGAVRLMLLTGQRLQEILRARWDQVNFSEGVWLFPRNQTKNQRPHLLPLTTTMDRVLKAIPRVSSMVFPHARDAETPMPYRSVTQAIERLRTRHGMEPFTPRDLRRTCTTHWARIEIQPSVRFQLQNRALGDVESKHYNLYDGLPEKRAALEKWERELERIVEVIPTVGSESLAKSA